MNRRPIMDAGPGLNFFSLNQERLLFKTLGALAIPETVENEIRRKARHDQRFAAAEGVINKVPARLLEILSDDTTDPLTRAVSRITGVPLTQRRRTPKDLGEIMVVAHAVVAAEAGSDMYVLIDDSGGRKKASREDARLSRLRDNGEAVGQIRLISTVTVLKKAAERGHVPDRAAMRALYLRLREIDDGLMPLDRTGLMTLPCWSRS